MHEFFTWARAEAPVWRDERNGLWAVTRHADVLDVERRSDPFSSQGCYRANVAAEETNMIAQDDPGHIAQRRLVNRRFTPRAVQDFAPMLQDTIDELVDKATEKGDVEVVVDLAAQLPSRLTAHMLGFPEERWPDVKSWSERLMRTDALLVDQDALMGMITAITEFNQVLTETAAERRTCPADDLISIWVGADLDPMSMMHETGLFIAGGAETTRTVIARGLHVLAQHPEQWAAMGDDPSLVPAAVEEVIRWVTPLNNFFRTATRADRIGAQPVEAGDRVMIVYPSANRDGAVFDDPFRFDIRRDPNPHLAFGQGTHFCLGANLARMELRMLFESMARRWKAIEPVFEPDIEPNIFAGAVRSYHLRVTPR
ncbi:MAG: cytochrome P450 [Acidimicrobiia bacterium]|nr:cytochrome P450 [Acidimicrobiia bacterium]